MSTFDLLVIGSGPGGHAAALAGSRRGLRVAVVDQAAWGGVCLNVGCIPTKALITVARRLRAIQQAKSLGIEVGAPTLRYAEAAQRNQRLIAQLRQGLSTLLTQQRIELIQGRAAFRDAHTLDITAADGSRREIRAERVVIASGAQPTPGPWAFDGRRILSYRDILALTQLPESLLIIGGGVIGCEFASCFSLMGARVTLIEQQAQLLPAEEPEAVRLLARSLESRGVVVRTETTVRALQADGKQVRVTTAANETFEAKHCLVAIGSRPNTQQLGLEALGIGTDGGIAVNQHLITSQPHIAAIGDCLKGHGLAHLASAEGLLAIRNLYEATPDTLDLRLVPRCVYTDPEIARVGLTEAEIDMPYRVSRFSFAALGKAACDDEMEGFAKILADAETDQVLGVTIVGHEASSLIQPAVLAMQHRLTAKQLAHTITPHPTWAEGLTEAAAQLYGEALSTGHAGRLKQKESV